MPVCLSSHSTRRLPRVRQESDRRSRRRRTPSSRSTESPSARARTSITDAIEGVTLNLLKNNAGTRPHLMWRAIQRASRHRWKHSSNRSMPLIRRSADLSSYNTAANKGGVLQGDSAALSSSVGSAPRYRPQREAQAAGRQFNFVVADRCRFPERRQPGAGCHPAPDCNGCRLRPDRRASSPQRQIDR